MIARRVALGLAMALAPAGTAAAAPPAAPPPVDPRMLDELALDLARFTEAVQGYRGAANNIVRRAYIEKLRGIRSKYEPLITLNEAEEREKRLDAIAMFEAFLRKHPNDRRWTPDAMFRLAELYYEKASDEFLIAQEAYQKALDSPSPPDTQPPKPDYSKTIALYRTLLTEFPNYRLLDAAYYLLGFCLSEMGQEPEAKQALLALTCANRYRPLDPPPPAQVSTGSTKGSLVDTYKDCEPAMKDSKFLAEAWTRVGEMHFDAGELALAISAYGRVLEHKDSAYYDKALYKLAWAYYRDNRFVEAIGEFDRLVKFADEKKASGDKFGSDLRPEAVQYLGVSFSEPDWDGDTLPDAETGLQRALNFYKGREGEAHVKEVFQRLGDIYFDQTKYAEAIAVYKALLANWPSYAEAPKIQDKIVRAFERDRNLVMASKERESLGRNYSKGSDWWNANRADAEALAVAQQLAEDALLIAATNVHSGAQACREKWNQNRSDLRKLDECQQLYRTSAELYEKYLIAYPNSKRTYEFTSFYADALYYGGKLPESIVAYQSLRDSVLDNKYQQVAAFQMLKAYEEIIEKMKAEKRIDDPPIPDENNTRPPVAPIAMPDIYRRYTEALDWYIANINDEKVPDMRYAGAVLLLRYRNWPEARGRLSQLTDSYCTSKPEIGFKAYDAILKTYFIDYKIEDEEQKDCALGRLLNVAEQFTESPCGKAKEAGPYLSRIQQIRASVKSTVITKRLQLAMENEEKGTNRQLVQCREGGGGIDVALGITAPAAGATTAPGGGKPATSKIDTSLDVALALDLIDLVEQNPKDEDAPTNLNNACVIYEKLYRSLEATKCYERLARDYPNAPLAKDALWNAARSHRRFFEFDRAVQIYQQIATDPKFAGYEHRKEALGLAATLLDNDQQYARAADFYKRYSDMNTDKPKDAAQSFSFACNAFEKMRDGARHRQCLQDLVRRFGPQPAAGDDVVQAYLKLAVLAEQSGNKKATFDAYKKVKDEFVSRRLQPATPAAAAAAKAEYLILEDKFRGFQGKSLYFTTDEKQVKRVFDNFTSEGKALQAEYAKIWDYKDANWTLASFLRRGDIFYEFAQKLIKAADNPPDDIKKLDKKACRMDPSLCGTALTQYKDAIFQFVTPVEDEAKKQWKSTLDKAAELGVTNEYVKKARENLSKYLPDQFPFIKDERILFETP